MLREKIESSQLNAIHSNGINIKYINNIVELDSVQALKSRTREAETGLKILSLRPTWSTELVPGQPGLHRETF